MATIDIGIPEADYELINDLLNYGDRKKTAKVFEHAKFYGGVHLVELIVESDDLGFCCAYFQMTLRDADATVLYSDEFYGSLTKGRYELHDSEYIVSMFRV